MTLREELAARLTKPGIIAVVRAPGIDQLVPMAEALVAGGVLAVEITLTTPNAIQGIREVAQALGSRALVGVGTVLNRQMCLDAVAAGAQFVVSPITKAEILQAAHSVDRPVMLGAYTPTEAQTAHELGSDFIKLFPADGLGPEYVKALRAPLPHLRIVPTGGVDVKTVAAFFKAGCVAVGVGSALVSAQILRDRDWASLTRSARELAAQVPA